MALYDYGLNKVWELEDTHGRIGGFTDLEVVNNSVRAIDSDREGSTTWMR